MQGRRLLTAISAIALGIVGCSDPRIPTAIDPATSTRPPQASQVGRGWIIGRHGLPVEVGFSIVNGVAILEGDIVLGLADSIPKTREALERWRKGPRFGVAIDGHRWIDGVVQYSIHSSFSTAQRQVIMDAMTHVAAVTDRISFAPVFPAGGNPDFGSILFAPGNGCSSYVGRIYNAPWQEVALAPGCFAVGVVAHEILHALGLWHEQSRCDRDIFVEIHLENVQAGKEYNFDKHCDGATDWRAYDEGSVMHYDPFAFSSNGQPTIVSKRGLDGLMGQQQGLSTVDRYTLNDLYGWNPPSPPPAPQISVTYPDGVPNVSWTPATEGDSYTLKVFVHQDHWDAVQQQGWSTDVQLYPIAEGWTLGPPIVDTYNSYTGNWDCYYAEYEYNDHYTWGYELTVNHYGYSDPPVRFTAAIAPSCY